MKRIKKTLIAGVLACSIFNNAQAELSPFSYGLKVGGSISSSVGHNDEAKLDDKSLDNKFFDNPFVFGSVFGEYAFTDYIGAGLEVGYLKQGATLTKEEDATASNTNNTNNSTTATNEPESIGLSSHTLTVAPSLCIYPLGREEEEGILKICLGHTLSFPFSTGYTHKDKEVTGLTDDQKKEGPGLDVSANIKIGYEFLFGLSIEAGYGYGFLNRFTLESDKATTIFHQNALDLKDLKSMNVHNVTLGLGYNFASLFSE